MEQQRNCVLVDKFAIFIQILLGTIAFSTLIYKRHRERPQRPLSIWAYDVSKQIIGAFIIHGLNIVASYVPGLSEEAVDTNPCVWYFLNILVDCTLGVFVLFLILKIVQALAIFAGIEGMKSGDYGQPPKVNWWLRQTVAFVFCLSVMKTVVVAIFRLCPFLFDVGKWLLGWTLHDVKLQVVFVMLIFPLVMNIVQFWIVDQVIKKKFEGMKLEDSDHSVAENEMFLPVDISDDEMHSENSPSYLKGSNVSFSSDISTSASLLRETFSNAFDDEDKYCDDGLTYIELLRKTPSPNVSQSHLSE